ncbi:MAG TPA: MliC family protein [Devosiaceae bacterium]|jgi:membrane-bound inhibitor of C-type lysozyme|nr:MliC family protein [Devosiaceae bacterium]
MQQFRSLVAALPLLLALPATAGAVETALQLVLELPGNAERNIIRYECDGIEPFAVDYVNAAPTFLAILPIEGERLLFVNVIAASGARYVSGQYEWWTRGSEATLTDAMAPEGTEPLACLEIVDTP